MSSETWLDVLSDWASSAVSGRPNSSGFSNERSKIMQEAFKQCFTVFAEKVDFRLRATEKELEILQESMAGRGGEVTLVEAATNFGKSTSQKNAERKDRRRRTKAKLQFQRSLLLKLRPIAELRENLQRHASEDATITESRVSTTTHLRCIDLNANVTLEGHTTSDVHGRPLGIPANVLAHQCQAVRLIQKAWRRRMSLRSHMHSVRCDSRRLPLNAWNTIYSLFPNTGRDSACSSIPSAEHVRRGGFANVVDVSPAPLASSSHQSLDQSAVRATAPRMYYAVQGGTTPGVYSTWDEAKRNMSVGSMALCKKFSVYEDAADFATAIQRRLWK